MMFYELNLEKLRIYNEEKNRKIQEKEIHR